MPDIKLFIGSKIIQAFKHNRHNFLKAQGKEIPVDEADREGYQVEYPDGYISWSPKEVFENAYREITEDEKKLILY